MRPATASASATGRPAAVKARTMKAASRSEAMRVSFVVMLVMLPLRGRDWFNAPPHHKIKQPREVSPYEYDDRRKNRHHQCLFRHLSADAGDRKSTRLNSSHMSISYAVFCLKKKKK